MWTYCKKMSGGIVCPQCGNPINIDISKKKGGLYNVDATCVNCGLLQFNIRDETKLDEKVRKAFRKNGFISAEIAEGDVLSADIKCLFVVKCNGHSTVPVYKIKDQDACMIPEVEIEPTEKILVQIGSEKLGEMCDQSYLVAQLGADAEKNREIILQIRQEQEDSFSAFRIYAPNKIPMQSVGGKLPGDSDFNGICLYFLENSPLYKALLIFYSYKYESDQVFQETWDVLGEFLGFYVTFQCETYASLSSQPMQEFLNFILEYCKTNQSLEEQEISDAAYIYERIFQDFNTIGNGSEINTMEIVEFIKLLRKFSFSFCIDGQELIDAVEKGYSKFILNACMGYEIPESCRGLRIANESEFFNEGCRILSRHSTTNPNPNAGGGSAAGGGEEDEPTQKYGGGKRTKRRRKKKQTAKDIAQKVLVICTYCE